MKSEITASSPQSDTRDSQRAVPNPVLSGVANLIASLSGKAYFESLVAEIIRVLGCRWAAVCETVPGDPNWVRTLAMSGPAGAMENQTYSVVGSPCSAVLGQMVVCYPHGVREKFPQSVMARELNAESYFGLPLFDTEGRSIGMLAVVHDGAMDRSGTSGTVDLDLAHNLLPFVAGRTAAEVQRYRAERAVAGARQVLERYASEGGNNAEFTYDTVLSSGIDRRNASTRDHLRAKVVDEISDAVVGIGFDTIISFWNKAAEKLYGFTAEYAVGRSCHDLYSYIYPDTTTDAEVGEIVSRGGSWVREMQHITKAGRLFDVHVALALQKDERGTPVGVLAVFRDITELKAARDAATNTRRMFECFMDYSPAMAYMKDDAGRFVYVSAAMLTQSGLTREQLLGKTASELWPSRSSDQIRLDDHAVWQAEKPLKLQYSTNIEPYGERHWMTYKFPVRGAARERLVGGLTIDITDRVKAEEQLRERERTYREASEANRRLLTELDHRVRNNLASLIGLIGLMRETTENVGVFATALQARLHGMAHVHQLMASTGYQAVELRTLIDSLLQVARGLSNQPIAVVVDGPAVRVEATQVLPLTMILFEWFTNSCKYGSGSTPGGQVDLHWNLEDTEMGSTTVRLHWIEYGGPPITTPITPSLGTSLVKSFATRELRGTCDLRYPPTGVEHRVTFSASGIPSDLHIAVKPE